MHVCAGERERVLHDEAVAFNDCHKHLSPVIVIFGKCGLIASIISLCGGKHSFLKIILLSCYLFYLLYAFIMHLLVVVLLMLLFYILLTNFKLHINVISNLILF